MTSRLWKIVLIPVAILLTGCGAERIRDDNSPVSNTLVFGYMDTKDAVTGLDWLRVRQVHPRTDDPLIDTYIDDQMFYGNNFRAGAYQIDSFGAGRFALLFPRQGVEIGRFKLDKPGLRFIGSFKLKKESTGIFNPSKFELEPLSSPTERELLERLLKLAESKAWEAKIKKRIQELSK